MHRNWLPLNALRAFAAAGQQLSFTAAANSLTLAQSAVSRQVIVLEKFLCARLRHSAERLNTPCRVLAQPWSTLLADELAVGRLIRPFDVDVAGGHGDYRMTHRNSLITRPFGCFVLG